MNIQAVSTAGYGANLGSTKRSSDGRVQAPAPKTGNPTEKLEISDTSSEMATVRKVIDAQPEVRLQLVKDINARIAINDYPISNNMDSALKKMLMNGILSSS